MESTNEIVVEIQMDIASALGQILCYCKMSWLLRGEGDSWYTQRVQGVCPKPLTDTTTRKEYVDCVIH